MRVEPNISPEETRQDKISLIVPVLNDDAALKTLLTTLAGHNVSGHNLSGRDIFEIIIVDSTLRAAPPLHISQNIDLPIKWVRSEKGRGRQIKAGLTYAQGDYIWILHADSQPHPQSIFDIKRLLSNPNTAMGCFAIRFISNTPAHDKLFQMSLDFFAQLARFESQFTTFGDQGFFFRRKDYNRLELDLNAFPLLEDVALRRAFDTQGRIRKSKLQIIVSPRRFVTYGVWRTQFKNMAIMLRYIFGENPAQLYTQYYQNPANISTRPPRYKRWPISLAASLSGLYPRARIQSSKSGRTR